MTVVNRELANFCFVSGKPNSVKGFPPIRTEFKRPRTYKLTHSTSKRHFDGERTSLTRSGCNCAEIEWNQKRKMNSGLRGPEFHMRTAFLASMDSDSTICKGMGRNQMGREFQASKDFIVRQNVCWSPPTNVVALFQSRYSRLRVFEEFETSEV